MPGSTAVRHFLFRTYSRASLLPPECILLSRAINLELKVITNPRLHTLDSPSAKRALVTAAGGLYNIRDVMDLLAIPSKQGVAQAVLDRRLWALGDGDQQSFPICQFDPDLKTIRPIIIQLLRTFPHSDGWHLLHATFAPVNENSPLTAFDLFIQSDEAGIQTGIISIRSRLEKGQ